MFLSIRCQFVRLDDQAQQAVLDDLVVGVGVMVEPNGIEPLTS